MKLSSAIRPWKLKSSPRNYFLATTLNQIHAGQIVLLIIKDHSFALSLSQRYGKWTLGRARVHGLGLPAAERMKCYKWVLPRIKSLKTHFKNSKKRKKLFFTFMSSVAGCSEFVLRSSEFMLRVISLQNTTTNRTQRQWTALEWKLVRIWLKARSVKSVEVCLEMNVCRKRITPTTREDRAYFSRSTRFVLLHPI